MTYPLQVLQTRLRHSAKESPAAVILDMLQNYHLLYRGLSTKIVQTVAMSAFQMSLYERIVHAVLRILLRDKAAAVAAS